MRHKCERILERVARENGMKVLGWRDVPVDNQFVGPTPRSGGAGDSAGVSSALGDIFFNQKDFDRRLYLVRQRTENEIEFGQNDADSRRARAVLYLHPVGQSHRSTKGC